eukprot:scaffold1951_cov258-Pinguiococcus_pyrenoidosus.AAC.23
MPEAQRRVTERKDFDSTSRRRFRARCDWVCVAFHHPLTHPESLLQQILHTPRLGSAYCASSSRCSSCAGSHARAKRLKSTGAGVRRISGWQRCRQRTDPDCSAAPQAHSLSTCTSKTTAPRGLATAVTRWRWSFWSGMLAPGLAEAGALDSLCRAASPGSHGSMEQSNKTAAP